MQNVVPDLSDRKPHGQQGATPTVLMPVPSTKKPAHYALEQARAKASQIVSTAFAAAGLTRQGAADCAGVARSMIDRWTGDYPRSMPLGRVLVMANSSRRGLDAARMILTSSLAALDGPATQILPTRPLRDMVDDMHAEVGDVAAVWRAAMLDGEVSASEAKAIIKEVHEVELVCQRIRHEAAKIASGERHE